MHLQAQSSESTSSADEVALREMIQQELPGCDPTTVAELAETARVRVIARGDVIYEQGERVSLNLILRGFCMARRTTADGQYVISNVFRPGRLFGFSAIAPIPSAAEAIALTEGELSSWPGLEVRALAAADPALALAAVDALAAGSHGTLEQVEWYMHQDARRRVVRILAMHRDLFFDEPAVLDRTHLPGLVGTSREMTARVLRQLEREGTVARQGRAGLQLLRPDQLEADPT